jgi:hypothetical protein
MDVISREDAISRENGWDACATCTVEFMRSQSPVISCASAHTWTGPGGSTTSTEGCVLAPPAPHTKSAPAAVKPKAKVTPSTDAMEISVTASLKTVVKAVPAGGVTRRMALPKEDPDVNSKLAVLLVCPSGLRSDSLPVDPDHHPVLFCWNGAGSIGDLVIVRSILYVAHRRKACEGNVMMSWCCDLFERSVWSCSQSSPLQRNTLHWASRTACPRQTVRSK